MTQKLRSDGVPSPGRLVLEHQHRQHNPVDGIEPLEALQQVLRQCSRPADILQMLWCMADKAGGETRHPPVFKVRSLGRDGNALDGFVSDVVLLLPVPNSRANRIFRKHGAVDLHWRQGQLLHNVSV